MNPKHNPVSAINSLLVWLVIVVVLIGVTASSTQKVLGQVHVESIKTNLPTLVSNGAKSLVQDLSTATIVEPQLVRQERLNSVLDSWALSRPKTKWGVAILGLDDGVKAGLNQSQAMSTASVYKLFLVSALDHIYPASSWDEATEKCVQKMIQVSDNVCADLLVARVGGWQRFSAFVAADGYVGTSFLSDDIVTTANDSTTFMKRLVEGKALSTEAQTAVLSAMKSQYHRKGIPAGCKNCEVWNKTGDYGLAHNDVGMIQVNGKRYLISILSGGAGWSDVAQLTRQLSTELARP
jgi:beta-lactamase class A